MFITFRWAFAVLAAITCVLLASCSRPVATSERAVKFYQSPMHPWITSDEPGQCTICGMDLVPVYEGAPSAEGETNVVALHDNTVQALGVTTVPVRRLALTKSLRFSGIFEDDENLHRVIAAFYDGRIEDVFVDHVGQYVEKGQPLVSIYSPELLYVVREFQSASRSGDENIRRNAAQRLVQFGLTPDQVDTLSARPDSFAINILAPISGVVVMKDVYRGQYITTGEPLLEMGDLSRLWFHAEVYERDLPGVAPGQPAVITTPTVPGQEFPGVVTFIDPNFDPASRTTKVRIEVDNPVIGTGESGRRHLLPHRAYAEAQVSGSLGEVLVLPRSAVLRDGSREVVYVERSPGAYEPRDVRIGRVGNEGVEILDGLDGTERVVVQGNLLIDAEAQLRNVASPVESTAPPTESVPDAAAILFRQIAEVSQALASDDATAAVAVGNSLPDLAKELTVTGAPATDVALAALQAITDPPTGEDLAAVRRNFLPWSQAAAELAQAFLRDGADPGVRVFECPMTGDSFAGAPTRARWIQSTAEVRNPYLGAMMLTCGAEVKP